MAQDTSLTALSGGSAVAFDCALKMYHRTIDFSVENLASGDHFEVFTLPAGALVVAGIFQITTLDSGGGTLSLGTAAGTGLLSTQALSAATCVTLTAGGAQLTTASDTIDLLAGSADITTAVVKIWLLVIEPNGAIAHG